MPRCSRSSQRDLPEIDDDTGRTDHAERTAGQSRWPQTSGPAAEGQQARQRLGGGQEGSEEIQHRRRRGDSDRSAAEPDRQAARGMGQGAAEADQGGAPSGAAGPVPPQQDRWTSRCQICRPSSCSSSLAGTKLLLTGDANGNDVVDGVAGTRARRRPSRSTS